MYKLKHFSWLMLVTLSLPLSTASAQSVDVNELMKTFQNEMADVEGTLTFSEADINSNNDVTIKGFDLFIGKVQQRIKIDELTLDNVRKDDGGLFRYDGYIATGNEQTFKNPNGTRGTINAGQITVSELTVTTTDASQNPLWNYDAGLFEFENTTFQVDLPEGDATFDVPLMTFSDFSQKGVMKSSTQGGKIAGLSGMLNLENGKSKFPLSVEELSFSNINQLGASGFEIGEIVWGKTTGEFPNPDGRTELLFEGFTASNIYSPDLSNPNAKLFSDKRTEIKIGALEVLVNSKPVFTWQGGFGFNDHNPDTGVLSGSGGLEKMMIDFSAIPIPDNGQNNLAAMRELGYEQLTIDILANGKWDLDTGTVELTDYDIDVKDAGSIRLDVRISGYTEEVARNIQTIANEVNAETDPQAQQLKSMQMIAALTTLSVERLKISIEDQSLLNKVVSYQAAQVNQEPEQITQIVAPMAQVMLAPYNVPEFAASVSFALNTFMQGNKSISITAEPEGGLVMTEIIALSSGLQAGQITPAELIKRLNLKVEAE